MDVHYKIGSYTALGEKLIIENNVKIGNHCEVGDESTIREGALLQGRVRLGPLCYIGHDVIIKIGAILADRTHLEENVFIGPNVITLGGGPDRTRVKGAYIERNCYIGAGSKIAAGIRIVHDTIIGANSFVNKDITEPGTYAGTPVRRLK